VSQQQKLSAHSWLVPESKPCCRNKLSGEVLRRDLLVSYPPSSDCLLSCGHLNLLIPRYESSQSDSVTPSGWDQCDEAGMSHSWKPAISLSIGSLCASSLMGGLSAHGREVRIFNSGGQALAGELET